MKPEPGLDLSNPEPEPPISSPPIDQNEKVLEFLAEHHWTVTSMEQTGPSMHDMYTMGSRSPVLIPAGPGTVTLTITVFL